MKKKFGVLCHVTSVPSDYGVGDFGRSAKQFVDFLASQDISIWQILPLNETENNNCPYSSICYFSYDDIFVDVEALVNDGLVEKSELAKLKKFARTQKVQYEPVKAEKKRILALAYNNLNENQMSLVKAFASKNPHILEYAYFKALLNVHKTKNWRDIERDYWTKDSQKYKEFFNHNVKSIYKYVYVQYILDKQWQEVRKYAKSKGIIILGDLPIYPDPNSFDVFNSPESFQLDKHYQPIVYGGVPADDFCADGQFWGTCIYNWENLAKTGYQYMIDKIKLCLDRYDVLRLDHFLGYTDHYEISAKNKDPLRGKWVKAGGEEFFNLLSKQVDMKRLVIEDLGLDRSESAKVRNSFGLKGMAVLQMALEADTNIRYFPKNVIANSLYYLGTHDNNTFMGYLKDLPKEKKIKFLSNLDIRQNNNKKIHLECLRQMMNSKSNTVIVQMQDLLFENGKFRMNMPGQAVGGWDYRVNSRKLKTVPKVLKLIRE